MGASQSSDAAPDTALHILRVAPNSPASLANLEPFFDYIVGVDGLPAEVAQGVKGDPDALAGLVRPGVPLTLIVWSSKTRETRLVSLTPSAGWAAPGSEDAHAAALLGISARVCKATNAGEQVWHVLDVLENSPAESAGLVPFGDWIVGWSGGPLARERDFYEVIEAHLEKPLRVYVYSYDFDTLREVVLVPNRHWGGEGLLGCVFGFGMLHRIPTIPTTAEAGSTVIFRPGSTQEAGPQPKSRAQPSGSEGSDGVVVSRSASIANSRGSGEDDRDGFVY